MTPSSYSPWDDDGARALAAAGTYDLLDEEQRRLLHALPAQRDASTLSKLVKLTNELAGDYFSR